MTKQGNDSELREDTNYTSHSPTGQPSGSSPHLYTHLSSGSRQFLVPVTITGQKEMQGNKKNTGQLEQKALETQAFLMLL